MSRFQCKYHAQNDQMVIKVLADYLISNVVDQHEGSTTHAVPTHPRSCLVNEQTHTGKKMNSHT
jgi:hypothetical protein